MTKKTEPEAPKRSVGRPRKSEVVARSKGDPLANWRAEQALKKAKAEPLTALVEESLKDKILVPKNLDPAAKRQYLMLFEEFSELGIDVKTFKRVHMLLAKLYTMEEICEKELKRIGGVAYKTAGESIGYREHPAAKHLHATRTLILNTLKSLGLTPTSRNGGRFEKEETEPSPFDDL